MNYILENDELRVEVAAKGAELQRLWHKKNEIDYLWNGDAASWGKKRPVLFPIVGGLKNNPYRCEDTVYHMGRHGFARDMTFAVEEQTKDSLSFIRTSNEETWAHYPFNFNFIVRYQLLHNRLMVTYHVKNKSHGSMYFSVGGHPAFKVPFVPATSFNDYYLKFSEVEDAPIWPLSAEGLIEKESVPFFKNEDRIALKKELFYKDALVFKYLRSNSISIVSDKTDHGITVKFDGFPYMGIWSARDADFVCIEPWCGIADSVDATGKLEDTECIQLLEKEEIFERTWSVALF